MFRNLLLGTVTLAAAALPANLRAAGLSARPPGPLLAPEPDLARSLVEWFRRTLGVN